MAFSVSDRVNRLVTDVGLFALGSTGSQFIGLLMLPLYAKYLTPREFGLVDISTTAIALLLPLFTLSMADAVLRFVMMDQANEARILRSSTLVVLLGMLSAVGLYSLVADDIGLGSWGYAVIGVMSIQALQGIIAQYCRGTDQVRLFTVNSIVYAVLAAAGSILLLGAFGLGPMGYLLSLAVASGVGMTLLLVASGAWRVVTIRASDAGPHLMRRMLQYSIPLVPNAALWWAVTSSSRLFLLNSWGLSAVGLFAVAARIPSFMSIGTLVFSQAWQISAIEQASSKDRAIYFGKAFDAYAASLMLMVSGLILISKPLLIVALPVDYEMAWRYVPLLLVGSLFMAFSAFYGTNYLVAMGTRGALATSLVGGLIAVGSAALLVPPFAGIGAGLATALGYLVMWLLRLWDTRRLIEVSPRYGLLSVGIAIISMQTVVQICFSDVKLSWVAQVLLALALTILMKSSLTLIARVAAGVIKGRPA